MKKVYTYFVVIFSLITLTFYIGFSFNVYKKTRASAEKGLDQILGEVDRKYKQAQVSCQEKLELIEKDYLNRVKTVAFILEEGIMTYDTSSLRQIRDMMEFEKLYVVAPDGKIVRSVDPRAVGRNLKDAPKAAELYQMATGESESDTIFSIGKHDEEGNRLADYVACRIEGNKGLVVSTFSTDDVDEAEAEASVTSVVRNFLTEYTTTIAVVDQSGKVLRLSENNRQNMEISGVFADKDRLNFLEDALDGKMTWINGEIAFAMARKYPEFFICAYVDSSAELRNFILTMVGLVALLLLAISMVLVLLKWLIQKYLIQDLNQLHEDIDTFLSGNMEHEVRECHNPELEILNNSIRRMREGYLHKNERMNKVIGGISSDIAMFESLEYTNSVFFSDNMQKILGLNDRQFRNLKFSADVLRKFLTEMERRCDANGMVYYNNHWLKITAHRFPHEYFGIIEDKTEEYLKSQNVERQAIRDSLTGLYNRAGVKQKIAELLENDSVNGVGIMLDMDNFKRVNDNLGHPEGDRALQTMAACIEREFRKSDIVGRLGGDEFFVFMQNVPARETVVAKLDSLLEAARRDLAEYSAYQVTVSVGVVFTGEKITDYKSLYEGADTALYIAKALGKDQYYINDERILCMERNCRHCEKDCTRKKLLGL